MTSAQQSNRTDYIDILRGFAVLGMMLAHSIFFFHDGSNDFLNTIQQILNLTMFPLFVFTSGLTLSAWLDRHHERSKEGRMKILKRTMVFYLAYVMLAIISVVMTTPLQNIQHILYSIAGIITFTYLPNFTEYFPFFIILSLAVIFVGQFYRHIRLSLFITLIVGMACYVLGLLLYPLQLPFPFDQWKALFASGASGLRFPILFYLLTYVIALWWYKEQKHSKKIGLLLVLFTFLTVVFLFQHMSVVSFFSPFIRWPPSLGNIVMGIAIAGSFTIILSLLKNRYILGACSLVRRIGIYAFEIWIIHLLILFAYDKFITIHVSSIAIVCMGYAVLLAFSLLYILIKERMFYRPSETSSVTGARETERRFKKRYLVVCLAIILFLTSFLFIPNSSSLYGDSLSIPTVLTSESFPEHAELRLTADSSWILRSVKGHDTLTAHASLYNNNQPIPLDPKELLFSIDGNVVDNAVITKESQEIIITVPSSTIPIGQHTVSVSANRDASEITSNTVMITVSHPLLFAWTLDWEGWNAPDPALEFVETNAKKYQVEFTHFVSPRTFTTNTLSPEKKKKLSDFLKEREKKGDEIAMHLHMHFDFVKDAGVIPRTKNSWGLYTEEGYDIPTTEYTPDEFRDLISYGRYILSQEGFQQIKGYRAGGWFLTTDQLNVLEEEGFTYDSSAREKPSRGAFMSIPWNITFPAQPYYPDIQNQNRIYSNTRELLEIPNNGGNTYEFTPDEIFDKLQTLYLGTYLEKPLIFVVVSHPQFSQREFSKVAELQRIVHLYSVNNNNGPLIFTTMSEIDSLWRSSNH